MLKVIKKRRSYRKYQSKEVEEEKLNEILKTAMFSPSAKNRRPWEFVVIKNPETKERLSRSTIYSSFVKDAPVVLVICADETKSARWVEDCSILAENIYLEVTNQSLGTCFIQIRETKTPSYQSGEEYVREVIKAPKHIRILCLMPLGYPDEKKEEHHEAEFEEEKIHQGSW